MMRKFGKFWVVGAALLVATGVTFVGISPVQAAESAYSVKGKVTFAGDKIPAPELIRMSAEPHCVKLHAGKDAYTEGYVIDKETRSIANVFVKVKEGVPEADYEVPAEPVKIDQHLCRYEPHVMGVMAGQKFEIISSDEVLHNINIKAKDNRAFNIAMPKPGSRKVSFRKPEAPIQINCDAHNWMEAWVHVLEHPYFAVTNEAGEFEIPDLPPGKYVIEAWHEKLGTVEQEIEVKDCDAEVDFEMGNK